MCIVACCEHCTCPGVGSPANPSFARCARLVCFVLPAFEAFLLLAILDPSPGSSSPFNAALHFHGSVGDSVNCMGPLLTWDFMQGALLYILRSSLFWTLIAAGVGILMLLYIQQDKILYMPAVPGVPKLTRDNPTGFTSPSCFNLPFEDAMIPTSDGVRIHAWLLKARDCARAPTIVFFHGNAGNIGFRLPGCFALYSAFPCNILMVDYRGYGHSEGEPNEEGLMKDADAVMGFVKGHADIGATRVVVYGQSLGGAVALYVADKFREDVAAVVLENTFFNVSKMVDKMFSWLGVLKPLVLRIYWPSNERIARVTAPILFICGTKDDLVPPTHSKDLYALANKAKARVMYEVEGAGHNDCGPKGGVPYILQFSSFVMRHTAR